MTVFYCNYCGLRVEAESRQWFCGDQCRKESAAARAKARRLERRRELAAQGPKKRPCLNCRELFTPAGVERICSDRCRTLRSKKFYRRG